MICLISWEGKMNQRESSRILSAVLVSLLFSFGAEANAKDKRTDSKSKDKNSAAAQATNASPDPMPQTTFEQSKLAPDKREAIKRLMTVTRLPKIADSMYDMLLAQGQKSFELSLARSIQDDTRYSDDQKKDLLQKAVGSTTRMFARYRELLPSEINLPDVLESVFNKVYDKYFSAKELNDISDFYQTPAGKKALDVLPQVMTESAQMTGEIVTPKVKEIVAKILQEERASLEAQDKKPAAGAAPAEPKK